MHAAFLALFLLPAQAAPEVRADLPKVIDKRLTLELFAEAPQIVTPVAMGIDSRGRVLCIESHTHFRPKDYAGPTTDRIQAFEDTDGDGRADRITTFYEGLTHTMGLGVYYDGSVYVATRSEIVRLRDADGDGKADEKTRIAHLETTGNYPHNGLSGFAFDILGNVYFGFGENLGADYKLIGSDGVTLKGGGEGGNIYRCGPNGQKVMRIATGFWNPFHLCFDAFGRLFAVDNDPDSRPPCRLLHIVEGGDYGYRFRNGRRGTHPFTAWNGELPGTLPMVAGTGEAPSGILAYESDNFPDEYRGDLLVTSWGDHRIERYKLKPRGASFSSEMQPVVVGGENFRPVGIALAPDGSIYFSDWVDKSYQLHGKGRIWRLRAKEPPKPNRPTDDEAALASPHGPLREEAARRLTQEQAVMIAEANPDSRARSLAARMAAKSRPELQFVTSAIAALQPSVWRKFVNEELSRDPGNGIRFSLDSWLEHFMSDNHPAEMRAAVMRAVDTGIFGANEVAFGDPFIAQAVANSLVRAKSIRGMLRNHFYDSVYELWKDQTARSIRKKQNVSEPEPKGDFYKSPRLRMVVAIALRTGLPETAKTLIKDWLADPNPDIRLYTVIWIGEDRLTDYRPQVEALLNEPNVTRQLFEACLAALERLDGSNSPRNPKDEWRGEDFVLPVLMNEKTSANVKRMALRTLRADHPKLTLDLLKKLLADPDEALRIEALRTLRESPHAGKAAELLAIASDEKRTGGERAEAIVGLSTESDDVREKLVNWACMASPPVSYEALRTLRGAGTQTAAGAKSKLSDSQTKQLTAALTETDKQKNATWRELARHVVGRDGPGIPAITDLAAWVERSKGPADAAAGERIFFNSRVTMCFRCHEFEGRGARVGPDLTSIHRSATRERLVESILQPSREIAPHFVPWMIETTEGQTMTGMYVGEEVNGTLRFVDTNGKEFRLKPLEIEHRLPSPKSIMPEGLASQLTLQEFRDLIAFLLRGE